MKPVLMSSTCAIASDRGLLVAIWWGEPNDGALARAAEHMVELSQLHPGEVFMFNVITETAGMPTPQTRELLKRLFQSVRGKLIAAAVVLEKRGILHSLSRAMLTSLITVARQPFAMKVFGERQEAMTWISSQPLGPSVARLRFCLSGLTLEVEREASQASK